MDFKHLVAGCSIYLLANSMCLAAQGTLDIRGKVVESSCTSHAAQSAFFELRDCPLPSREPAIHVDRIDPLSSVHAPDNSQVNATLANHSARGGQYYNQQYLLLNDRGTPIQSGTYVVTLTEP